ncbi:MAG: type II secretion system protein [Patescibacteria group bacterium]
MIKEKSVKGFTLIELLVVIAILAVLATAVVLIINPAELIRQGRDSTRLSDLDSLNTALSLYLADVDPVVSSLGACSATAARCTVASASSTFAVRTTCSTQAGTGVDGTGWLDVNLGSISGGSPLPRLPLDPANEGVFNYQYGCDNTNDWYEINAKMESDKYERGGGADVESTDGGHNVTSYEVGNDPGFDL